MTRKYTTSYSNESTKMINYTIKSNKYNRIAHVMPNYLVNDHLKPYPELVAKLRACLRANLNNSCEHAVVELHGHQNTVDWMIDLYDFGFEIAVIWTDGTWPLSHQVEEEIIDMVENHWHPEWMGAGMIVNRKREGWYPYWDYSYPVIINLKKWAEKDFPYFINDKPGAVSFETFEKEVFDDLNPKYMFKSGLYKNEQERGIWFDGLIGHALHKDCWIQGLKEEAILEHIHHDNLEEDIDDLLSWIHNNSLVDDTDINLLRSAGDKYNESRLELYTLKLLKYQIVYITNTEGVPKDYKFNVPETPLETLILPCSGLHQFYHIINNIDSLKRVVWFDFNPYSVNWMERVVKNWNGKDFKGFVEKNRHTITESEVILDDNIIYDPDLVDEFMETMGLTEDQWIDIMAKIRKTEQVFLNVDAVKEYERLVEAAGSDSDVFLQLTNIWQYEVNYLNTDMLDAQLAFLNLLNNISKNNKSLFLTGDTPMGVHYRYKNIKELKGVF